MNTVMNLLRVVVILSLTAVAHAQQRRPRLPDSSIRISKRMPTVHITFARFGKREPRYNDESDEGVWLRVHNNTGWPLVFHGFGRFTRNDEEVTLFYRVEEIPKTRGEVTISSPLVIEPPPLPSFEQPLVQSQAPDPPKAEKAGDCKAPSGDWGIHVVAPITLPPSKSMIFSVPREALCRNLKIYIVYNYSWEKQDEYRPFDYEPEHRVYFRGSDLPKPPLKFMARSNDGMHPTADTTALMLWQKCAAASDPGR
jgi:hypothetical protein